ncbi:MAG: cytochrome P450 [Gaiellaceae bacterium]
MLPEAAPGAAELRRDPEQALLAASALGELVRVRAGRRRLLLVSGPEGARETLVERAGELAKPRSQAIPLGRKRAALPAARISPAELRRALSKGMGADRAEETARELATGVAEAAAGWQDGDSIRLVPWLRPLVARAVVRGAFASDLTATELDRLARIVAWAGGTPRVLRSVPTRHGLQRPFLLAQLSLVVRSLLANADRSRPSELSALEGLPRREQQALAGELLLGAAGPLVQESGWALYRFGTEPEAADREAFVREVTRLHPTNPLLVRVATADTSVGGEPVQAGELVVVHVGALHRDPGVFPEPERFLPERWLDGRTAEHRFSYAAFGIGDRRCLGETIALRSLVDLLETVGREWRLSFGEVDVAARGRRQLSDDVRVVVSRAGA